MTTDIDQLAVLQKALRYERSHSQECKANYWGSEASENLNFDDATTILESCICSHRDALAALDVLREALRNREFDCNVLEEVDRLRAQLERQEAAMNEARLIAENGNQYDEFYDIFRVLEAALSTPPSQEDEPVRDGRPGGE